MDIAQAPFRDIIGECYARFLEELLDVALTNPKFQGSVSGVEGRLPEGVFDKPLDGSETSGLEAVYFAGIFLAIEARECRDNEVDDMAADHFSHRDLREVAGKVERLMDTLDELDDVVNTHINLA